MINTIISDNTIKKLLKNAGVNRSSPRTRLVMMNTIQEFVNEVAKRAKLIAIKERRNMINEYDILKGLNGNQK